MSKNFRFLKILSVFLIISIALIGCSAEDSEDPILEGDNSQVEKDVDNIEDESLVSSKFPEFKLKDLDGKDVSSDIFNDYKITIVPVWQSTCGPCIFELKALNTIYDEYKDEGVNVLGISLDDVENMGDEDVKKVADTLELEYVNIIADSDYLIELENFVQGTPTAYIIGEDGEILFGPKVGSNGTEEDIKDFKSIIKDLMEK